MSLNLRPASIMLLTVLLSTLALPALAQQEQSPAQLRIENQQLRDRIEQLDREIASAQRRIDALESANQRLRDRLDGATGPAPSPNSAGNDDDPPRETAPIPTDPFAAPAAMHAKLLSDYTATTQGMTYESRTARIEYLRALRKWAAQSRRDINGRISWTVAVLESSGTRGQVTFTIEVLDTASDLPIGQVLYITVTGRNVQKLNDAIDGSPVTLEGVFSGTIEIDESLETSDKPMFLGPFATLAFQVNVRTVR